MKQARRKEVKPMIIYTTRYQANKARKGDEITVKVCGGYTNMAHRDYQIWLKQK